MAGIFSAFSVLATVSITTLVVVVMVFTSYIEERRLNLDLRRYNRHEWSLFPGDVVGCRYFTYLHRLIVVVVPYWNNVLVLVFRNEN